MLEVLRERLAADGATNVVVETADAAALPYPDGSFDGVVMANLLHLVPDPARVLAEARRVLTAGGRTTSNSRRRSGAAVARPETRPSR
jgi:ubiquinone/menaquinone biosynthesis C-methylase UbiE